LRVLESINPTLLPAYAAALAFGYLCGSIPFGLILTRLAGTQDIRSIGSGNIGATNVLRTGNKKLAAATLLLDALKAAAAAWVMAYFVGEEAGIIAGFFAFIGHLFPVWIGFKGGKGVATYIGVLLGLFWPAALAFGVIWLGVAFVSRYSSLAALVASAIVPLMLLWSHYFPLAALFAILSAMLWYMHRANIKRLLNGTEGKIGSKA
jgi:glycerol-3-phosphate acyltransferase PlsY